jgi:hypothetical protein
MPTARQRALLRVATVKVGSRLDSVTQVRERNGSGPRNLPLVDRRDEWRHYPENRPYVADQAGDMSGPESRGRASVQLPVVIMGITTEVACKRLRWLGGDASL